VLPRCSPLGQFALTCRLRLVRSPLARRLGLLSIIVLASACGDGRSLRDALAPATPRERYAASLRAAGLDRTALGRDWLRSGERALRAALPVALPFRESGYFPAEEATAVAYQLTVRGGQRVIVSVGTEADEPFRCFIDLFQPTDSAGYLERVASADEDARRLEFEPQEDGVYLLRLQPELLRGGRFTVTVEREATLAFPVGGKDRRAIQSFFGAARDGGRRSHQGIDIFAPRGTPAVAAAEGVVRWVGTNRLGGKVVWVWDTRREQSLYYAHLDSQIARIGELVRVGDTLGLVGNTGNARTTKPHLHFGVYRRGYGAVDPYPRVYVPPAVSAELSADTSELGSWGRTTRDALRLRASPTELAPVLMELPRHTPVRTLGASGSWFRVRLPDGAQGYASARMIERADSPIRSERLARGEVVRDRPTFRAAVMDSVHVDTTVPVFGQFADFLYVQAPSGRAGWTPAEAAGRL
jgi:murein DD-endopeptidase MepM/ murein hydrolase activator NlpD